MRVTTSDTVAKLPYHIWLDARNQRPVILCEITDDVTGTTTGKQMVATVSGINKTRGPRATPCEC